MQPAITLVELGLACWRLSSMLTQDDGPYDLFGKGRSAVGVHYDEWGEAYGTNVVAKALTCIRCTSVWVSLLLLAVRNTRLGKALILWLAVSGGAIAINEVIGSYFEKSA